MRAVGILIFFVCMYNHSFSQGRNNFFLMGYDCGMPNVCGGTNIDFKFGFDSIYSVTRTINLYATHSNISDTLGNLLFYTNGIYIANKNDDTLYNSGRINPETFVDGYVQSGWAIPQGALNLPLPGTDSIYYLFHLSIDDNISSLQPSKLYLSIIDMSLDSGLGGAVSTNNLILQDIFCFGQMTACKHGNGRDWWIMIPKWQTNTYFTWLLTPLGLQGPYQQNIGNTTGFADWSGQACFSPDGTKYARYDRDNDLFLFDFDRCSGALSNFRLVPFVNDSLLAGGVAFSPDSKLLYLSQIVNLYQYNTDSLNIAASEIIVAEWDTFYSPNPPFATTFYLSQLAPDGKIYIICSNSTIDIHVINNPNSIGLNCDVCQHCVHLPTFNAITNPNHPNYHLGEWTGSVCDSLSIGIEEMAHDFHFNVFPNPVSNQELKIIYSLPQNKRGTFEMFDVSGRKLYSLSLPQWSTFQKITLPQLSKGVYVCKLKSGEHETVKKIVVQ